MKSENRLKIFWMSALLALRASRILPDTLVKISRKVVMTLAKALLMLPMASVTRGVSLLISSENLTAHSFRAALIFSKCSPRVCRNLVTVLASPPTRFWLQAESNFQTNGT
jgi:hypothetical protein